MVGQIDDDQPTVLEETLRLGRAETHEATAVVVGGGDAIIVTWVTTPDAGTSSFPIETPGCPTDPADVRDAGQVTTTLAQP